jgi:hypothetical protein
MAERQKKREVRPLWADIFEVEAAAKAEVRLSLGCDWAVIGPSLGCDWAVIGPSLGCDWAVIGL